MSVQSSTSLQFLPLDLSKEKSIPDSVIPHLAFAQQKLDEIVRVAKCSDQKSMAIDISTYDGKPKKDSGISSQIPNGWFSRPEAYNIRRKQQPSNPPFATTTIGSFPQTPTIRQARSMLKKGVLSQKEYDERMAAEIGYAIGAQDAIGLDVLVHGGKSVWVLTQTSNRLLIPALIINMHIIITRTITERYL